MHPILGPHPYPALTTEHIVVWSILFVWFGWTKLMKPINEINPLNQMNQINQINQINQMKEGSRSSGSRRAGAPVALTLRQPGGNNQGRVRLGLLQNHVAIGFSGVNPRQ